MDAYREDNTFVIHLDLPGVATESIDLTVERNVLTVHAERRPPRSDSAERVVAERSHGVFSRQVFLGDTLDAEQARPQITTPGYSRSPSRSRRRPSPARSK